MRVMMRYARKTTAQEATSPAVEPSMSALKGVKIQKKTIVVPMVVNCSISSAIAGTTLFRMAKKYPFKQAQTAINGRPGASRRRGSPLERSKKRCARKSDPIHRTPAAEKLTPRENSRQRRIQTGEPRPSATIRVTERLAPLVQVAIARAKMEKVS